MPFNVSFYKFSKRENSTARPSVETAAHVYPVRLKDKCGIINPVLVIRLPENENPSQLNYAYIPDFYRFYFINEWQFSGGLWVAALEVDVLATYKFNIGPSTQYVLRASAESDGNIMDSLYPGNGVVSTAKTTTDIWPSANFSTGCYVIGIINTDTNTVGAVSYYVFSQSQFSALCAYLMGSVDWLGDITEIGADLLKALYNPFQYIVSCIWFPEMIAGGTGISSVPFGWWSIPVSAKTLRTDGHMPSAAILEVPKHPQAATRGNFLNFAPYADYVLDSRVWGTIPLDTAALKSVSSLSMTYNVDYVTGMSEMIVEPTLGGYIFARCHAMFGTPIQLAQIAKDYIGQAVSTVGTAATVAAGLATENFVGAITGGISGIGNMMKSAMPGLATGGSNGSLLPFTKTPSINARFINVVDEDNADRGRPLCKAKRIDTISGYIMVADADISLDATAPENQKVKRYMESGFFYE